jgi:hypothetical protein
MNRIERLEAIPTTLGRTAGLWLALAIGCGGHGSSSPGSALKIPPAQDASSERHSLPARAGSTLAAIDEQATLVVHARAGDDGNGLLAQLFRGADEMIRSHSPAWASHSSALQERCHLGLVHELLELSLSAQIEPDGTWRDSVAALMFARADGSRVDCAVERLRESGGPAAVRVASPSAPVLLVGEAAGLARAAARLEARSPPGPRANALLDGADERAHLAASLEPMLGGLGTVRVSLESQPDRLSLRARIELDPAGDTQALFNRYGAVASHLLLPLVKFSPKKPDSQLELTGSRIEIELDVEGDAAKQTRDVQLLGQATGGFLFTFASGRSSRWAALGAPIG